MIVEGSAGKPLIRNTGEINDLLSSLYNANTDKVLLHSPNLPESFFDVSSKVAGDILQKFSNYNVRAAIVMDNNTQTSSKFDELRTDLNTGGRIHFFDTRDEAISWLINI